MFDFISYARDTGLEIKILPMGPGVLIAMEIRDPETGFFEKHEITNREAASCANIDTYTGRVLDQMAARIGRRKAQLYASRHTSQQMRDREDFFREA